MLYGHIAELKLNMNMTADVSADSTLIKLPSVMRSSSGVGYFKDGVSSNLYYIEGDRIKPVSGVQSGEIVRFMITYITMQ